MTQIPSRNLNDLYDKGYQALDKDVVHIEYNLEPDQAYVPWDPHIENVRLNRIKRESSLIALLQKGGIDRSLAEVRRLGM